MMTQAFEALLADPKLSGIVFTGLQIFTRLYVVVTFFPGIGGRVLPARIKVILAASWSLYFFPQEITQSPALEGLLHISFGLCHAIFAGLMLGLILKLTIFALELAGELIAQVSGFNNILGLTASQNNPLIPQLLGLVGAVLLLSPEHLGHLFAMIEQSFILFPINGGVTTITGHTALAALAIIKTVFEQALMFAAPFVLLFTGYNLLLGFINRAFPSLMITFIAAPFSLLMCLVMMWVFFPYFIPDFVTQTRDLAELIWERLDER